MYTYIYIYIYIYIYMTGGMSGEIDSAMHTLRDASGSRALRGGISTSLNPFPVDPKSDVCNGARFPSRVNGA